MTSTSDDVSGAGRVRALLEGLRGAERSDDNAGVLRSADAEAILDDAWSLLSQLLADGSTPFAAEVLNTLRRLSQADRVLLRSRTVSRLGGVLTKLEAAQCSVQGLVAMAPVLIAELGFDRAIVSRIDEGLWTPRAVFVADDPEWAEEINRVGQQHPQPLVPGLIETELVRRRQGMIVYDVQEESRVHRAIADESRSRSYVAAPIMSGDRVVGILHSDRYLQGRDVDDADRELLVSFAHGLQLALSRASVVEQLNSIGSAIRGAAVDLDTTLAGAHDVRLDHPRPGDAAFGSDTAVPMPMRPPTDTETARAVRAALTNREFEVLEMVALGRTNAAIASRLVISEGTVKQHVKHILRKLRVQNRAEAVSRLYQSRE